MAKGKPVSKLEEKSSRMEREWSECWECGVKQTTYPILPFWVGKSVSRNP